MADGRGQGGTPYAAQAFRSLGDLYGYQRDAARFIIKNIHNLALDAVERDGPRQWYARIGNPSGPQGVNPDDRTPGAAGSTQWRDPRRRAAHYKHERPQHVFLIDGTRGTGKTSLILTLEQVLKHLLLDGDLLQDPTNPNQDALREEIKSLNLESQSTCRAVCGWPW